LSLQKLCATNCRSVKEQKNTHNRRRRRGGVQWRPPTRACARSGGRGRRSQGRRRSVTWARAAGLWAATSTAAVLGELERWGEQGNGRREGGRAKEGGRKYMGGPFVPGEATTRDKRTFCPGWWLYPGQKGLLGGPGKFPARGPPLVPGRSTTRDKRGRFPSFPPNVMFVFVSFYFSFKIGFHLLIQLIKL